MKWMTLLLCIFVTPLCAQPYIGQITTLLEEKKFDEALTFGENKISRLKSQNKSDKQLEMLTYLAVCLNPQTRNQGCVAITEYFNMHKRSLENLSYYSKYLNFSQSVCAGDNVSTIPSTDDPGTVVIHTNSAHSAGLVVYFKGYEPLQHYSNFNSLLSKTTRDNFDRIMGYADPSGEVRVVGSSRATPAFQIFGTGTPSKDVLTAYVGKIFHTVNFFLSKHLVIVSPFYSLAQFQTTAAILEKTLDFYHDSLHIPYDPNLIFIYLIGKYDSISRTIHEIDPSAHCPDLVIGYSNTQANSVFAWIPSAEEPGTIKHELIHILLKNKLLYPDWFEEGLASLYEESRVSATGGLVGINNWRLTFLKYLSQQQLSQLVDGLIFNNVVAEDSLSGDISSGVRKASDSVRVKDPQMLNLYGRPPDYLEHELTRNFMVLCNDALSRYFLVYLQAKNKIGDVLGSLLQNQDALFYTGKYASFESLLLGELGFHSGQELKIEFIRWLTIQSATDSHITNRDFRGR